MVVRLVGVREEASSLDDAIDSMSLIWLELITSAAIIIHKVVCV